MRTTPVILLILALGAAPAARAGAPSKDDAAKLLHEGDYADAAKAYRKWTRAHPDDAEAWFALGSALHRQEKFADAVEAYDKAIDAGFYKSVAEYDTACAYARMGRADDAFAHLKAAAAAGFADVAHMKSDDDLKSLHGDARWSATLLAVDEIAHPCAHDPHMAQFDFWVGTWTVTNPKGTTIGHSHVSKRNAGCVVFEEWTGAAGADGMSMNYYDPSAAQWVQVWRSDRGVTATYHGGLDAQGRMVLTGPSSQADGKTSVSRGIWTKNADGTVTQQFFASKDGKAWKPVFEGIYSRVVSEGSASSAD